MLTDKIKEIGVDNDGRLYVRPCTQSFPYIYREAMEVQWDSERGILYSPPPREWSYVDWFKQIHSAAKEQGVLLRLSQDTTWIDVPEAIRSDIIAWCN